MMMMMMMMKDDCHITVNRAMYRIFHIGDYDYDNVWQLRQILGLCSIRRLVECRR